MPNCLLDLSYISRICTIYTGQLEIRDINCFLVFKILGIAWLLGNIHSAFYLMEGIELEHISTQVERALMWQFCLLAQVEILLFVACWV